jgi:hypothetical protein
MQENQLHNGYKIKDKRGKVWLTSLPYLKSCKSNQDIAAAFLSLIWLCNIRLGSRELQFLSYMMMRDGQVAQLGKKLYMEQYNVPKARVDNMVSQLKKKKVLIKKEVKVSIHHKIVLPFKESDNFIFQFRCQKI